MPSATTNAEMADLVRVYLDQAGEVELLSHEEEADLAKRIHAGGGAAELLEEEALRPDQRARLRRIVVDADRARQRLIDANLRLVVATIRRFRAPAGVDLSDLIQEGNIGLIYAVDRFDPARGFKFSTYATWWIRQCLQRGCASASRTIRVPEHVWDEHRQMREARRRLQQTLARQPTDGELAEALDWSLERLEQVRRAFADPVSLDSPVGPDGDTSLGELVADPLATDPHVGTTDRLLPDEVGRLLDGLTDAQRQVVELRYGLDGHDPLTLEAISERIGVSRERVRQIEKDALAQLLPAAEAAALVPTRPRDPLRAWTRRDRHRRGRHARRVATAA